MIRASPLTFALKAGQRHWPSAPQRPIMAVAHAFVVIAFHMLFRHEPYCELGPSYLDKQRRDHFVDRLTRRMQRLGYRVHLEPVQTA
jgi:hypothetical protein